MSGFVDGLVSGVHDFASGKFISDAGDWLYQNLPLTGYKEVKTTTDPTTGNKVGVGMGTQTKEEWATETVTEAANLPQTIITGVQDAASNAVKAVEGLGSDVLNTVKKYAPYALLGAGAIVALKLSKK